MPEINANFVVQPLDITIAVTETNLTLEPDPVQLNIFTEGFAPPGGANTELQYNDSGTLDGVPGTSYANNKLTLVNVANLKIPGGSNAFYLQTDGTGNLSFVAGTGNVTGNGTAAGANTQIQFTDGSGNFVSNAGFTFSNATNTFSAPGDANIVGNVNANNANLTGNIIAVNANFSANINANNANITNNLVANVVKTDNLQYANGTPYDLTQPGGILHNIQFNDGNGNFGGDNAFIFNPTNNTVGLTGNFNTYNANVSVTLVAANVKTDNLLYANGTPWDFEQPGGSNTEIQFNDNGNLGGSNAFTFNKTSNVVDINGNLTVNFLQSDNANLQGGTSIANLTAPNANITNTLIANIVKTNNLQYSNGTPYDFDVPGGILHNIQFNDGNGNFGGDNAFIFNPSSNFVGLTGNFQSYNANITTQLIAGNANVTVQLIAANANITSNITASNANITNLLTVVNANVTSNIIISNANVTNTLIANIANITEANITNNLIANIANITGNLIANVANITNTLTANIANITGNLNGNTANFTGNITALNFIGNIPTANFANFAGNVTNAAQPNITSVGILTDIKTSNTKIHLGNNAGNNNQGLESVAIGNNAASNNQGNYAVAIGWLSGNNNQGGNAIAIGNTTAQNAQGNYAIAIGYESGNNSQGFGAIAIGLNAQRSNSGSNSIAIGYHAGWDNQGANSIAIGYEAGANLGSESIAIGWRAGGTGAARIPNNTTVIGGSGGTTPGLYIKNISSAVLSSNNSILFYDVTNEFVRSGGLSDYALPISASTLTATGNISGNNLTVTNNVRFQNANISSGNIDLYANGEINTIGLVTTTGNVVGNNINATTFVVLSNNTAANIANITGVAGAMIAVNDQDYQPAYWSVTDAKWKYVSNRANV